MSRVETADHYSRLLAQLTRIGGWSGVATGCNGVSSTADRRRDDWRARSYYREALRRCAREYAGAIEPAAAVILAALPARIDLDCPTGGESFTCYIFNAEDRH